MTLKEIKKAVDEGKTVYCKNRNYIVIPFNQSTGGYAIRCLSNRHTIGLTWADDVTLNASEDDFFIGELHLAQHFTTQH